MVLEDCYADFLPLADLLLDHQQCCQTCKDASRIASSEEIQSFGLAFTAHVHSNSGALWCLPSTSVLGLPTMYQGHRVIDTQRQLATVEICKRAAEQAVSECVPYSRV